MDSQRLVAPNQAPRTSYVESDGSARAEQLHENDALFICNVCLDPVKDPVVTQCGHLFCWPCLFRWLNTHHRDCPVCKAGVSRENVIPIFIEGNKDDPRDKAAGAGGDTPSRPTGIRINPQDYSNLEANTGAQVQIGGISFNGGFGFFPSLFGLQFLNFIPNNLNLERPLTPDERHQEQLTRVLFAMGGIVLACFIVF